MGRRNDDEMNTRPLTAGVARVDITPPVGFRMQGVMRRIEGAVGVESALLATVLVLADESAKVAIFDCDLIGFDLPLADEIREAVGRRLDIPARCVALGCTHTHNGPCTSRGNLGGVHDVGGDTEERAALDAYIARLKDRLVEIAAQADSRREPARAAAGRGAVAMAINREERTEDGRVILGRNPEGATDHSVDVLRVDDLDGKPIAVLTGYAAHPVVMGFSTDVFSQDFPGVVRRVVEDVTKATCLYLTGAAGNQACLSFLQDDLGEKQRMGGLVGCEAARVFFEIETRPHEVAREVGASLSSVAFYRKAFRDEPTHRCLVTASREVTVPLQPLPSRQEAEARLAEARSALEKLEASGAPSTATYPARMVADRANLALDKLKAGATRESLTFEIVGFRLDDFVLLGMPGEPFVEIGLRAKARSKFTHTMFAGYCNGILAYWPTAHTVAQGGMAVETAVTTYRIAAPPAAEAAETIVAAFDALLEALAAASEK
ncbi:MAG: hypothetical protein CMJ18_23540 [Phycisphaeraceae bacterium]|nr:hypothetical protein [Phycisphaeraceae bacterium]